jgi:hypothetical protein
MFLAWAPGSELAAWGRTVPKLVVSLGCAAGLLAACSSSRTDDWSRATFVVAQPTIGEPTTMFPGGPCESSIEIEVTVTDPAGNPVSGVTFPGNAGVCVRRANGGATPDAGAQDGSADDDALDAGESEGETALDARSADSAVDGGGAYDAGAPDAAEAGEGACTTWRFSISAPATVEVAAPGYRWVTAEVTWPSPSCEGFGTVPVVDRSVVLQPLPPCPADWGPCSRDAGLRGSPTSCSCP